jgi:hypothetical protein
VLVVAGVAEGVLAPAAHPASPVREVLNGRQLLFAM